MTKIWNFILENLFLFILGAASVLFIIILIIVVVEVNKRDKKEYDTILANITTPRIFVLDFSEKIVTYFNRGAYTERKIAPLSQFYHQFTAREVDDLEAWVNSLLVMRSGAPFFYKVDVFVRSERRSYASVIQVTKIDYEKKIIHLESYLYRYLKPKNQMNLSVKKKENTGYLGSSPLATLYKRRFARGSGLYGAISLINLFPKALGGHDMPIHLAYELQNQTAFYRSKRCIVRFGANNTVGVYLPFAYDEAMLKSILSNVMSRMQAYLEINGYEDYTVGAGLVRAKEFSDVNMGIKTAEELSYFAHKEADKMIVYDPSQEVKDLDLSLYRNEVKQIISRKSVDTLFQPLVVAQSAEIYGYLTSFVAKSPLFATYEELSTFARESKQSEGLIEMVLRKSAASYYNARRNPKQKLFIPLEVDDVPYIGAAFAKLPFASDISFVFMIEEDNFSERFVLVDEMVAVIQAIKAMGHEVTLIITDTDLVLPDDVYSEVDYFMVNDKILTHTVGDERERLYLLSSLGKLLRHHKMIAISEMSKWSEVEYYIRAGVDLVASEEISKKDPLLHTIEKKKALRIINFSKRK